MGEKSVYCQIGVIQISEVMEEDEGFREEVVEKIEIEIEPEHLEH